MIARLRSREGTASWARLSGRRPEPGPASRPRVARRRSLSVAACGALLIVIARAFATEPLLVPGVAFLAIGLLCPLSVWLALRRVEVERGMGAPEVIEGVSFRSAVRVRAGRLGLRRVELRDPLGGDPVALSLPPSLRGGRSVRVEEILTFSRRGLRRLEPPALELADPLGLAPAVLRGSERPEVLVLPRTEPVRWTDRRGASRWHAIDHGTLADAFAASEVEGLRPYRPGTPASRIHWAALARGAGLLERRLRAEQEARPLVVLDSRCELDELDQLDTAVRATASLVLELARHGGCGLLTADGSRPLEVDQRLAGWPVAHTRLALVERSETPPGLATRRRPGALFYVAAGVAARPPQALHDAGGVLVLPSSVAPAGRWPVSFEVAGCTGYALSSRAGMRAPRTAGAMGA